jgi:hypothetical protein
MLWLLWITSEEQNMVGKHHSSVHYEKEEVLEHEPNQEDFKIWD